MSEHKLSTSAIKLLKRKEELSNEEKRLEAAEEPEKPINSLSYEEAKEYNNTVQDYEAHKARINENIDNLRKEISDLEGDIKEAIPAKDVDVLVVGEYDNVPYRLNVKHLKDSDTVEVKRE